MSNVLAYKTRRLRGLSGFMNKVTKNITTIATVALVLLSIFFLGFLFYWIIGFIWALIWNYFIAGVLGFEMVSAIQMAGFLFCCGVVRSSFTSKSLENNATSIYSICKKITGESEIGAATSVVSCIILWVALFISATYVLVWLWNICFPVIFGITLPTIYFWNSFFILLFSHYLLGRSEK